MLHRRIINLRGEEKREMATEMATWPSEEQKKKVLLAQLLPEEKNIYNTVLDIRRCREASSKETCTGNCEYVMQDRTCHYNPLRLPDWVSKQVYWYANTDAYDELRLLLFLCHVNKLCNLNKLNGEQFPHSEKQIEIVKLSKRILDAEDAEELHNIALESLSRIMKNRSLRKSGPVDVESHLSNYPVLLEGYRFTKRELGESEVNRLVRALDFGVDVATLVNNHLASTARAEVRLSSPPPYRGVRTVIILIVTVVVAWAVASLLPSAAMPLAALVSFVNIALLDSIFRPSSFDYHPIRSRRRVWSGEDRITVGTH